MIDTKKFEGFTPGPWQVDDPNCEMVQIMSEPFDYICDCEGYFKVTLPDSQIRANAQLIAAAPELLAENEKLRAELAELKRRIKKMEDHWLRDKFRP
jgi:hypothetical protein